MADSIFIGTEDIDIERHNALKTDPESFIFECLSVEDVDKLLNESIECLCNLINCAPSLAKTLLLEHRWSVNEIVNKYRENPTELLVSECQRYHSLSRSSVINDIEYFVVAFDAHRHRHG